MRYEVQDGVYQSVRVVSCGIDVSEHGLDNYVFD